MINFSYFKEIVIWTYNSQDVALNALPHDLHLALQSSIVDTNSQLKFKSLRKVTNDPVILNNERISLSSFIILLCVVAIQAFPTEKEDKRMQRLFDILKYEIL